MTFLTRIPASNMFVRSGSRIYSLAPLQLNEILKYKANKIYDKTWLHADTQKPFFKKSNGYKHEIVYYVSKVDGHGGGVSDV